MEPKELDDFAVDAISAKVDELLDTIRDLAKQGYSYDELKLAAMEMF